MLNQVNETADSRLLVPILNKINLDKYNEYLLDSNLQAKKLFPNVTSSFAGYDLKAFQADNEKVLSWLDKLNLKFKNYQEANGKSIGDILEPTGSRSFGASYTESDLECAIVSNNFDDFLDFCRFLHAEYSKSHNFISIKTKAGLPLLIVKGVSGFACPKLDNIYPGKTLPQLEITFRHPNVHEIIQKSGNDFFKTLTKEELESYVFNKRYIELMQREVAEDITFGDDNVSLKTVVFEEFKALLSQKLKCLPQGVLQETPNFNKAVFEQALLQQASEPRFNLNTLAGYTALDAKDKEAKEKFDDQNKVPVMQVKK